MQVVAQPGYVGGSPPTPVEVSAQRVVEDRVTAQHAAGQEQLLVEGVPSGGRQVDPQCGQPSPQPVVEVELVGQRDQVGKVDQDRPQRPRGQCRLGERRLRGHEGLQGMVGLLDRPSEFAPQPDEVGDAHEGQRVGRGAVGVPQGGLVEVRCGVRVGEHQHRAVRQRVHVRLQRGQRDAGLPGERAQARLERVELLPGGLLLRRDGRRVTPVLAVVTGVADADAEPVEQAERRQLRVDEAGLDEVDELGVGEPQPAGERLGRVQVDALPGLGVYGLDGRRGGVGVPVQQPPLGQRFGVGQDRRLRGGEPEGLDEDVGPVRAFAVAEEDIVAAERLHQLGERRAHAGGELADRLDPQVERQLARVPLGEQPVVGQREQVLGFGEQLLGGRRAGAVRGVRGKRPVGDVVLQDLVDDVDVRQGGQGVLARQLDREQIRTALLQDVDGLGVPGRVLLVVVPAAPAGQEVRPLRLVGVDELQDVDEVRGRAEHRPAVRALDVVDRAEQPFHGREVPEQVTLRGLPHRHRGRGHRQPGLGLQRLRRAEHGVGDAADLLGSAVDQPGHRLRGPDLPDPLVGGLEGPGELLLPQPHDVVGAGESQVRKDLHRLVVGTELVGPVQGPDVLHRGREVRLGEAEGAGAPGREEGRGGSRAEHETVRCRRLQQGGRGLRSLHRQVALDDQLGHDVRRIADPQFAGEVAGVGVEPLGERVGLVPGGDQRGQRRVVPAGDVGELLLPPVRGEEPLFHQGGRVGDAEGEQVIRQRRAVAGQQRELALQLEPVDLGGGDTEIPGRAPQLVRVAAVGEEQLGEAGVRRRVDSGAGQQVGVGRLRSGRGHPQLRGGRERPELPGGGRDRGIVQVQDTVVPGQGERPGDGRRVDVEEGLDVRWQPGAQQPVDRRRVQRQVVVGRRQTLRHRRQRDQARVPAGRAGEHRQVLALAALRRLRQPREVADLTGQVLGQPDVLRPVGRAGSDQDEIVERADGVGGRRERDVTASGRAGRDHLQVHRRGSRVVAEREPARRVRRHRAEQPAVPAELNVVDPCLQSGGRQRAVIGDHSGDDGVRRDREHGRREPHPAVGADQAAGDHLGGQRHVPAGDREPENQRAPVRVASGHERRAAEAQHRGPVGSGGRRLAEAAVRGLVGGVDRLHGEPGDRLLPRVQDGDPKRERGVRQAGARRQLYVGAQQPPPGEQVVERLRRRIVQLAGRVEPVLLLEDAERLCSALAVEFFRHLGGELFEQGDRRRLVDRDRPPAQRQL